MVIFDLQVNVVVININCILVIGGIVCNQMMIIMMVLVYIDDGDLQVIKFFVDVVGNEVVFDYFGCYNYYGVGMIFDWNCFVDCGELVFWEFNENNVMGINLLEGQFVYMMQIDFFNCDLGDGVFDCGDVLFWDWNGYFRIVVILGFEYSMKDEIFYCFVLNMWFDLVIGLFVEVYVVIVVDEVVS